MAPRARRPVRLRAPRTPAPRTEGGRRRLAEALLVAVLLALLYLLLRPAAAPVAVAPPPPPPPPARAAAKPARPRPPPAPARPSLPSPRDRLLAAIREHAKDLDACELPPGAPVRAETRLHVSRAGVPLAVAFEGSAVPAPLAACLRERMLAWRLEGLDLPADLEVLVAFALSPG